jgi:hypothetical protein
MKKIYPSQLNGPISLEQAINHGKLLEGVFSVKESGIDSKIFHSWKLDDLLPTVPKGGWADLSFIDYLWLHTLETMRKFGCSKKLMKEVCNALFIEAYKEDLRKITLNDNVTHLTNLSKKRPLTNDEDEFLKACEAELNDSIRMSVTNYDINYFYQLIIKSFTNNSEVGLVIFEDGRFETYELSNTLQQIISNPIDLSVPHLLIPLTSFIKRFVADEEKDQFLTITGILNTQEYEVIKQIRNKNVTRLIITCDFNNKIDKIELEKTGTISGVEAKRIKELLGLKNYTGVKYDTRDGRTLSFTKTSKIYMDNK